MLCILLVKQIENNIRSKSVNNLYIFIYIHLTSKINLMFM